MEGEGVETPYLFVVDGVATNAEDPGRSDRDADEDADELEGEEGKMGKSRTMSIL